MARSLWQNSQELDAIYVHEVRGTEPYERVNVAAVWIYGRSGFHHCASITAFDATKERTSSATDRWLPVARDDWGMYFDAVHSWVYVGLPEVTLDVGGEPQSHGKPARRHRFEQAYWFLRIAPARMRWDGAARGQRRWSPACALRGPGMPLSPSFTLPNSLAYKYPPLASLTVRVLRRVDPVLLEPLHEPLGCGWRNTSNGTNQTQR
ncbi:hypothetical protein V8E55_008903 [Tylopilus felleus]